MELKYYTILVSPNYSNSYVLVKDWNKKNYPFGFSGVNHDGTECISAYKKEVYIKEDVDKTIAELQAENAQLKKETEFMHSNCKWDSGNGCARLLGEKLAIIDENVKLKQKLENVQASMYADVVDANMDNRRLKRALWIARAERYKMIEFIAREEGNLSNQMSWSRILRDRTYNQWVDQLLRIANLANKLQNKCRAKADEFGG